MAAPPTTGLISPTWIPILTAFVSAIFGPALIFWLLRSERLRALAHQETSDHDHLMIDLLERYQDNIESISGRVVIAETSAADWQGRYWAEVGKLSTLQIQLDRLQPAPVIVPPPRLEPAG